MINVLLLQLPVKPLFADVLIIRWHRQLWVDELNRSQDNNIHTLIVPMGKMSCDSSGWKRTRAEYRTEQQKYRLREQVVFYKGNISSVEHVDFYFEIVSWLWDWRTWRMCAIYILHIMTWTKHVCRSLTENMQIKCSNAMKYVLAMRMNAYYYIYQVSQNQVGLEIYLWGFL